MMCPSAGRQVSFCQGSIKRLEQQVLIPCLKIIDKTSGMFRYCS